MAEKLKRIPLHEAHVRLGAKLVPFAGFEMPVHYPDGISSEHHAVRSKAGVFDVSHMGEFQLEGADAEGFLNYAVTNDVSRLDVGQAQYTMMCNGDGGIVDDLLVYKFADSYRLVVNAANIEKDFKWISQCLNEYGAGAAQLTDESDSVGLLALQGPVSDAILAELTDFDVGSIGYYRFAEGEVAGERCVVSRTGYTGEDGFELYCDAGRAANLWRALLDAGSAHGLKPAGLGARDTLRLEMGYALYGNDIDDGTTPLEAGLGWTVKLGKDDFVGRAVLVKQKEDGVNRKLCGFVVADRGFPRPGYEIRRGGATAGAVRSGTVSPSLGKGIGTGYLAIEQSQPGTEVEIVIRRRGLGAEVTRLPFYEGGSLKR